MLFAYRVHQAEKGIVERWGKFKAVWDPGIHFLVPIRDSLVTRVDMRENVIDVPPQGVITRDNVTVEVDAIIYYYVVDPKAERLMPSSTTMLLTPRQ